MAKTELELKGAQAYKPSLVDRFINWVKDLPIKAWVFYVLFAILLILIQVCILWIENGLQASELLPIIIFNSFAVPFTLALIQFLDHQAVTAFNTMKPVLDISDAEFALYKFRLENMPYPMSLIAGLALVAMVLIMEQIWVIPIRYAALEGLPLFSIFYHIIDKSSAFGFGVIFYHTLRQLRLVNRINSEFVHVNLYNLGPLQAFSRLTGSTTVGLVIGIYGWMLLNPDLLQNQAMIGFTVIISLFALSIFVWPLYGVHRRMVAAKERTLNELDGNFENVFSEFNTAIQNKNYANIGVLNGIIASLDLQRKRIKDIPTWPWRPETARFALTAIAIPLVLSILRFLVERAFGT